LTQAAAFRLRAVDERSNAPPAIFGSLLHVDGGTMTIVDQAIWIIERNSAAPLTLPDR
jgi:hypothetical protein